MRWLRRISGIVWIFSWYTIYLEIFRWHHMTKSLRFNPPPPLPGTDIKPKAGAPLIAVCMGSVAAPLVFLTVTMMERMRVRPGGTLRRRPASRSVATVLVVATVLIALFGSKKLPDNVPTGPAGGRRSR
jgi:hypothetical protein